MSDLESLPEEDQIAGAESDLGGGISDGGANELEDQFAQDKQPGGSGGGFGANLKGTVKQAAAKQAKKGLVGTIKKYKITASIIGGLGFLGTAAGIFFFLLLFKNIHIKNLFIDYEFAKFNRGFNERLNKAIEEAKPTGTADTTVPPDASPVDQLNGASEAELEKLKTDQAARDQAAKEAQSLDQSVEGTGGEVTPDLGLERSVPDESTKSDEESKTDTQNTISEEVGGTETSQTAPIDRINKAAEDAQTEAGPNATNTELQQVATQDVGNSLFEGVQKVSGPFAILTFACIARDIWETGLHLYIQVKLASLGQAATTQFKFADGQKLNKVNLGQIGTVASQSDNGTQSFTQTAAYQRVTQQPVSMDSKGRPVNDLEEQMKPTNPGGATGQLVTIADKVINFNPLTGSACSLILKPEVQLSFAITNVVLTAVAAATGVIDFGISDVAVAAGQSAAAIFATKAGKALAIDAAMHYGGMLFKGKFNPIQWGNMLGAGSKALAFDTCRKNGCRQLSPQENQQISMAIEADQKAAMKHQSLVARLFDPRMPYSATGLAIDKVPTSPSAMFASVNRFFATVFNFNHLMASAGNMSLAAIHPTTAYAATVEYGTYGIPDFAFTDAELSRWSIKDNSNWVKDHMDEYNGYKSKCIDTRAGDALANSDPKYSGDLSCSGTDDTTLHFRLYTLDRRVTHDLVLLYNHQSDYTGASSTTSSSASSPGPFYMLGDSITRGIASAGLANTLQAKGWGPITIDGATSRSITIKGVEDNRTGLEAVDADASIIQTAKTIVVELGTNPGDSIDLTTFGSEIEQLIDKIKIINPTAQIFWVNIISTSSPQYPQRNDVITQEASKKKFTVIDARSANIELEQTGPQPGLHPTSAGYITLSNLIANTIILAPARTGQ